ncbi:MAG: carbohydrate-binding protein [Cytophagaceae bacterium]
MKKIVLILLHLFILQIAYSQCAKYEPQDGKVLFFIGQDCNATGGTIYGSGYIDDADLRTHMPAGITTYYSLVAPAGAGLNSMVDWGAGPLHASHYLANTYFSNSVISIGLYMTDGHQNTLNVTGGAYNAQLDALANWIKSISPKPVYLRIGYEFDGQYLNNPSVYRNAWIYIVNRFRSQNVQNVAYVWQAASGNGGVNYLMQWYPGDEYVDWVGYSHFEFDGNRFEGADIFTIARNKRKPVMIAEAMARGFRLDNATHANAAWSGYFTRLFNKIQQNIDVVKALCYINQDWDAQATWAGQGWGNSRIQNTVIEANWINELKKSYWLQASSQLISTLQNSNVQRSFTGSPQPVPGIIQAEDFDLGCLGGSYFDNSGGNQGGSTHRYGYSVDIGPTQDASGGFDVGWTATGEWLEYTVNVAATGTYNLTFRVSTPLNGNIFHLEQNGVNVTGNISVPNTGAWSNYTNLVVGNVNLSGGVSVIRIFFDNVPGFNLNYFKFDGITLSVEFSSFTAFYNNSSNPELHWTTSAEINNRHFIIERSEDMTNALKVGEVLPNRSGTSLKSYSFIDHSILSGIYYYRIKQEDFGGKTTYSKWVKVSNSTQDIQIFPNPAQGFLYIRHPGISRVEVLNLTGQLMLESKFSHEDNSIDVSSLGSGNYILKVYLKGDSVYYSRFIVQ